MGLLSLPDKSAEAIGLAPLLHPASKVSSPPHCSVGVPEGCTRLSPETAARLPLAVGVHDGRYRAENPLVIRGHDPPICPAGKGFDHLNRLIAWGLPTRCATPRTDSAPSKSPSASRLKVVRARDLLPLVLRSDFCRSRDLRVHKGPPVTEMRDICRPGDC
jgi:hypothetical protein